MTVIFPTKKGEDIHVPFAIMPPVTMVASNKETTNAVVLGVAIMYATQSPLVSHARVVGVSFPVAPCVTATANMV
jgi:hypothetical protein